MRCFGLLKGVYYIFFSRKQKEIESVFLKTFAYVANIETPAE